MTHEIEEEIALRHGNNLIGNLDEQTEAFGGPQIESLRDVLAEVFRSSGRVNFECLKMRFIIIIIM